MTETTHGADLLAATRFVQAGRLSEATAKQGDQTEKGPFHSSA